MRRPLTVAAHVLAFASVVALVALLFEDWYVNDGTPTQLKLERCEAALREGRVAEDQCCEAELDLEHELLWCENYHAELTRNCQCPWSPTVLESLEVPR